MSGLVEQSADARSKTIGGNFRVRAWVNFNGTGTVAIRGSGNVSSITDHGAGSYSVNFTTAMSDVNYSSVAACAEADVVNRFVPCMCAGLAYYMAMKKAPQRTQEMKLIYEDEIQRALAEDGSPASVYISPKTYYPEI